MAMSKGTRGIGSGVALLFDGGCGLCRKAAERVRALDLLRRVELVDAAGDWGAIRSRFRSLRREACLEEMHLVRTDGSAVAGFDAYRALAWVLPLGWFALPFLYLPGLRPVGRRIYAAVAGRRHKDSPRQSPRGV